MRLRLLLTAPLLCLWAHYAHADFPGNCPPNTVVAGPTSGPAAAPTCRTLTSSDVPHPVIRTYQVADIRDFGGVGDCATENSAAFSSALATNLPVYIPQGDFLISKPVSYTGAVGWLVGDGWTEQGLAEYPGTTPGCTTSPGSYVTIAGTGGFKIGRASCRERV